MAGLEPKLTAEELAAAQSHRAARRQLIKSAVAAFPVVLTVTAGTAQAQGSGGSATASFNLQGGALEGGSEEFDVQKYLDGATHLEKGDPFMGGSESIDPSRLETMPNDPTIQQSIGPIKPLGQ